jgi:mycoredoxin
MTEPAEIIIYGNSWCGGSRRARQIFDQHSIPYRWVDIEKDAEAARYVESVNQGNRSVPTIVWPDGTILVEPSNEALVKKLGIEA